MDSSGWIAAGGGAYGAAVGKRLRLGGGLHAAQIALDHREAVDHVAQRRVQRFQRVLRAAVGRRLAVTHVGQLASDRIDDAGGIGLPAAYGGEIQALMLEMPQHVGQRLLDPAEALRLRPFEALEQIGDALLDMGHRAGTVAADRQAIDALGQCVDRAFEVAGVGGGLHRPAFHRRRQQCDALLQRREHVVAAAL